MSPSGTFRTWRDVRPESAMRCKADMGEKSVRQIKPLSSLAGGRTIRPSPKLHRKASRIGHRSRGLGDHVAANLPLAAYHVAHVSPFESQINATIRAIATSVYNPATATPRLTSAMSFSDWNRLGTALLRMISQP